MLPREASVLIWGLWNTCPSSWAIRPAITTGGAKTSIELLLACWFQVALIAPGCVHLGLCSVFPPPQAPSADHSAGRSSEELAFKLLVFNFFDSFFQEKLDLTLIMHLQAVSTAGMALEKPAQAPQATAGTKLPWGSTRYMVGLSSISIHQHISLRQLPLCSH